MLGRKPFRACSVDYTNSDPSDGKALPTDLEQQLRAESRNPLAFGRVATAPGKIRPQGMPKHNRVVKTAQDAQAVMEGAMLKLEALKTEREIEAFSECDIGV